MSDLKLGQIIEGEQFRDAIHIAVAPVVAGEELQPGEHVALSNGLAVSHNGRSGIGIVDPFLREPVENGQQFWMFLYPGTIKGLRHEWTHPAFAASPNASSDKSESEKWLMEFCERHEGVSYHDMLRELSVDGGYCTQHGMQSAQGEEDGEEFRRHFKNVTGVEVKGNFTCFC